MRAFWRRRKDAVERKYFDAVFYQQTYTDIRSTGLDGFAHYMAHGWLEGRDPSEDFITLFYRDQHLDGQRVNPLTHFAKTGVRRRLATAPASASAYVVLQSQLVRPYFEDAFYRSRSAGFDGDLLQHYLRVGWREGLPANTRFNPQKYVKEHAYVSRLGVSPLYHFASQKRFLGAKETSQTRALRDAHQNHAFDDVETRTLIEAGFDRDFYLSQNVDVLRAGQDPLKHFLRHGWRENRMPCPTFDCAYYLKTNPTVEQSGVNPFYHYLAVGRAQGLRPHPAGTRPHPPLRAPPDWSAAAHATNVEAAACVVIMPVYKGYDETLGSIHAVLSAKIEARYALFVIDDCSPDPALSNELRSLAAQGLFLYQANSANLGFVKSVNIALRRFASKNVVLLNSDTRVFEGWLDRLIAAAMSDPLIATITPFSNNATIASYPLRNVNNIVELEIDAAGLDALAARCNAGRISDIPVGIGFCFFMSVAGRAAVGLLDEGTFGLGYGEENDFCLRATRAGYRNVLAEDVFVYHVGDVSFGLSKRTWHDSAQKALLAKYPDYPVLIDQHLRADTAEVGRIRLDLMRMAREAKPHAVVHVYHSLQGGIATHVDEEVRRLSERGEKAILIRVAGADRWSLDIRSASPSAPYCPNLRDLPIVSFQALLVDFIQALSPKMVHIHSLVGLDWQATLSFFDLIRASQAPYTFTLHDYSVVCHRQLLRPDGNYCGLADASVCRTCIAQDRSYPEAVDPDIRRASFATFLEGATTVIAPSRDIRDRLQAAGARYTISVRPHAETLPLPLPLRVTSRRPDVLDIVTLGAIGFHKGSGILLSLARDARARALPIAYHIVGYSDVPAEMADAGVTETGPYATESDAFAHVAAIDPFCVFLPSLWPETFSYTLSMAFALRCLPVVFDIGAPAERVRDAGFGIVLPYEFTKNIKAINDRLLDLWREG